MALEEARKGEEEIISLDGLYLKNTQVRAAVPQCSIAGELLARATTQPDDERLPHAHLMGLPRGFTVQLVVVELHRCSVHSDRDSGQPDRISRRLSSRDAICAALQVKKVIAALKGNAQTMTLVLSNNRISDAGCIALATALSESAFCPQLLSLDLRGNARVSEAGVRILVRTLPAQYATAGCARVLLYALTI